MQRKTFPARQQAIFNIVFLSSVTVGRCFDRKLTALQLVTTCGTKLNWRSTAHGTQGTRGSGHGQLSRCVLFFQCRTFCARTLIRVNGGTLISERATSNPNQDYILVAGSQNAFPLNLSKNRKRKGEYFSLALYLKGAFMKIIISNELSCIRNYLSAIPRRLLV